MKIWNTLASAVLGIFIPFAASAVTVFPSGFGAVFGEVGDSSFAVITVAASEVHAFDTPGFVDLIFDVTSPLGLRADVAFTPPGGVGVGALSTPFEGAQAFFIQNPDTTSFTPSLGSPVDVPNEGALGSTALTNNAGVQVGLSLFADGFGPNPGTITPGAGDNYALRIIWANLLTDGNLTVTMTPVPAAVPLPAGILLLGAGLAGLGLVGRRRKSMAA